MDSSMRNYSVSYDAYWPATGCRFGWRLGKPNGGLHFCFDDHSVSPSIEQTMKLAALRAAQAAAAAQESATARAAAAAEAAQTGQQIPGAAATVTHATRTQRHNHITPITENSINAPTQLTRYYTIFCIMIDHKVGHEFPNDYVFSTEAKVALTPQDDSTGNNNPTLGRSSTLTYYKKAISQFMGVPTTSHHVNDLVKAVNKKETRGSGVPSCADQECTSEEFMQIVDIIFTQGQPMENLCHQAIACAEEELAKKEPATPTKWLASEEGITSQWLFSDGTRTNHNDDEELQDEEACQQKLAYANAVSTCMKSAVYERERSCKLGTQSIRKYGTSKTRMSGARYEDVDFHTRWKNPNMQGRYAAPVQLNWLDISAAMKLCGGGPCIYKAMEGSGVTNNWLGSDVVSEIKAQFGPGVGRVLGLALLWAAFDAHAADLVPLDIRHQVTAKYIQLEAGLEDGVNPVKKVIIFASEHGGCVSLDEIEDNMDDLMMQSGQQRRNSIYAKLSSNQVELGDLRNFVISNMAQLS
eukprot:jgi/Psemu1/55250/gm1.55250_g